MELAIPQGPPDAVPRAPPVADAPVPEDAVDAGAPREPRLPRVEVFNSGPLRLDGETISDEELVPRLRAAMDAGASSLRIRSDPQTSYIQIVRVVRIVRELGLDIDFEVYPTK